jgi:hypothetical protein
MLQYFYTSMVIFLVNYLLLVGSMVYLVMPSVGIFWCIMGALRNSSATIHYNVLYLQTWPNKMYLHIHVLICLYILFHINHVAKMSCIVIKYYWIKKCQVTYLITKSFYISDSVTVIFIVTFSKMCRGHQKSKDKSIYDCNHLTNHNGLFLTI